MTDLVQALQQLGADLQDDVDAVLRNLPQAVTLVRQAADTLAEREVRLYVDATFGGYQQDVTGVFGPFRNADTAERCVVRLAGRADEVTQALIRDPG